MLRYRFVCTDKTQSPSIEIPVYVKDEVLKKPKYKDFPYENRGGTIVEDYSIENLYTHKIVRYFNVKHRHGHFIWKETDLGEIGGPTWAEEVTTILGGLR